MAESVFNGKRFATVVWGYDRAKVDELFADYQNWVGDLSSKLESAEAQLGESARHVRCLEAKVATLEQRAGDVPADSVRSFADRLDKVIGEAWQAGRTLREQCASEVVAEQDKAKKTASELIEAAKEQSAEILAEAEEVRQEAARTLHGAHEHAERMLEEGEASAKERARRAWDQAQDRLREAQLELESLEEQRQATISELASLRTSLESMVRAA